jgi:hypothetical protein
MIKVESEARAIKEYRELLNSGLFHGFYPALTGDWERDKEEWFKIHSKLEVLRASFLKDK